MEAFSKKQLLGIIQQVRHGNEDAFNPFFVAYFKKSVQRLENHFQSKVDAEDAVMNAIYTFWEKFIRGPQELPDNVEGYIYNMAKNGLINSRNKAINKRSNATETEHLELAANQQLSNEEFNRLIKNQDLLLSEKEEQLKYRAIHLALDKMGKSCYNIIVETILYGNKLKDLVKPLGFSSYNSIKSKASQCRKSLKKLAIELYKNMNV